MSNEYKQPSYSLESTALIKYAPLISLILILPSILLAFLFCIYKLSIFPNTNTTNINTTNNIIIHNGGLEPGIIQTLPVFQYLVPMKPNNEVATDCAICLGEFKEKEYGRVLPRCLHMFHIECIDKWFSSHSNCPLCRAIVFPLVPPSEP